MNIVNQQSPKKLDHPFCSKCGNSVELKIPNDDERARRVCTVCNTIFYDNPKIIVGSVACIEERILLCRRAIPPRVGFWTLPAGFMENGETIEEGACREAKEEANASLRIQGLLAVYSLKHIDQVQLFFKATLLNDAVSAGPESLDVGLFTFDEIPWEQLAFPTVSWALTHFHRTKDQDALVPDLRHRMT